jgi:ParB-like chromosome segregation protein Spo0J
MFERPIEIAGPGGDRDAHAGPWSVRIDALVVGPGPRSSGEDAEHTRRLMEVAGDLPPLLVHRSTMRVIDGVHRLRAAQLAGRDTVDVTFFDGSEDSAFVLAVEANVRHGLPLSVTERRAAAARIMASQPEWSDRWIGGIAGLSAKTVMSIRSAGAPVREQGEARVGRDGRVRPIDAASGRRRAGRLIAEHPDASLREIARMAGISPETVRNVKHRLTLGEDPIPGSTGDHWAGDRSRCTTRPVLVSDPLGSGRTAGGPTFSGEQVDIVRALWRDPSLRFSQSGRLLLRWLEISQEAGREWDAILHAIPGHRIAQLAELARSNAEAWSRRADQLSRQDVAWPDP